MSPPPPPVERHIAPPFLNPFEFLILLCYQHFPSDREEEGSKTCPHFNVSHGDREKYDVYCKCMNVPHNQLFSLPSLAKAVLKNARHPFAQVVT